MTTLLLGARTPAVEAAALGSPPWVISEVKPRREARAKMAGHALADFDDPDGLERAARALIGAERPDAVVATSERAVVPAARLRVALGVPGASVETAVACHDKHIMKARARAHGVHCAASVLVGAASTPESLVEALGLPMVLKPLDSSGSRGTTVARTLEDVEGARASGLIAESFVSGVEMSVEGIVSGGEIRFWNPTEYSVPLWASIAPAPLAPATRAAVHDLLVRTVAAFEIDRGLVHMEVFLTEAGPVFGELALRPPGGHLMDVLRAAYDFDPWGAFLACERGEAPSAPDEARRTAGARILHFGEGVVRSVEGVEVARALPGVVELVCRLAPGDRSKARMGSGVESGHVIAVGPDRDRVWEILEAARRTVRVRLAGA